MLERARRRGPDLGPVHQALGHPLQLAQPRRSVFAAVQRDRQMRDFVGQPGFPHMDLTPDLEQAEALEVARVVQNVAVDAGQQAEPHQVLIGGNGIRHAHVRGRIKPQRRGLLVAEEGVVVDFGEAPRGQQ